MDNSTRGRSANNLDPEIEWLPPGKFSSVHYDHQGQTELENLARRSILYN
jgi:hypothetical protein